jgi:hypothetical protein
MKLCVTYNVFDNEELLEDSINYIRKHAHLVSVVYQEISNYGNSCDENLFQMLKRMKSDGLIDEIVLFKPNLSLPPEINERRKNNIGYERAIVHNCDYHMGLACDEFYFEKDLDRLFALLEEKEYDVVTSYMYTYYKSSKYRFKEVEDYVVPVVNKVYKDKRFLQGARMPILIDPTRRMEYDTSFCFPKEDPIMHHLSHVREDFEKKLRNSTAKVNWEKNIPKMVDCYKNWKPNTPAFLFDKYVELEETDAFKKEIKFKEKNATNY